MPSKEIFWTLFNERYSCTVICVSTIPPVFREVNEAGVLTGNGFVFEDGWKGTGESYKHYQTPTTFHPEFRNALDRGLAYFIEMEKELENILLKGE